MACSIANNENNTHSIDGNAKQNRLVFDFYKKIQALCFVKHNFSGDDSPELVANNFTELLDMISPGGD
jgi:hypothetical protein